MISYNYQILFNRQTPAEETNVVEPDFEQKMPDDLNYVAMIDRLADGDITKHEQIYNTNYIECLNLLSLWHYRDEYQKQVDRRQQLKNKML